MVLLYQALYEDEGNKAIWWRLDYWFSRLLAWCLNLFSSDGNKVQPSELLPDQAVAGPKKQTAAEMASFGRMLADRIAE